MSAVTPEQVKSLGLARAARDRPQLAAWLRQSAVVEVREAAAVALGWQRGDDVTRALVQAATDDSAPAVRRAALRSLGIAKDPAAEPAVELGLGDADALIRSLAVRLAGLLGLTRLGPALQEALRDESPEVVREAALACGRLGDRGALKPLLGCFATEDEVIHRSAGLGLGDLVVLEDLPLLLQMLRDRDADVRGAALRALTRLKACSALEQVRPLLDDPHSAVQRMARSAVEVLERGMEKPGPDPGAARSGPAGED